MNYRTWHKLSHGHSFAVTIENLKNYWINWNKCSRKSNIPHVSTSKMIWNECYTIATYPSWAFHVWFYGFCERTYNDEWEWSQEKWTGLSPLSCHRCIIYFRIYRHLITVPLKSWNVTLVSIWNKFETSNTDIDGLLPKGPYPADWQDTLDMWIMQLDMISFPALHCTM